MFKSDQIYQKPKNPQKSANIYKNQINHPKDITNPGKSTFSEYKDTISPICQTRKDSCKKTALDNRRRHEAKSVIFKK